MKSFGLKKILIMSGFIASAGLAYYKFVCKKPSLYNQSEDNQLEEDLPILDQKIRKIEEVLNKNALYYSTKPGICPMQCVKLDKENKVSKE